MGWRRGSPKTPPTFDGSSGNSSFQGCRRSTGNSRNVEERPQTALSAGQQVGEGRYTLHSTLGLGGFGEVFLAAGADGPVAIKVVDTALWSEREYRVFNALMVSEASFLSTLEHPALPRLREFFAESSRYFLVMDWVAGPTVEELVRTSGPLSLKEGLKLFESLLEALEYLHETCYPAVIFGDLKPANVVRDPLTGAYRLVDLGLVTREGVGLTGDFAVYSPPFSAPERARGQSSARSHDIFSLSATVLHALLGEGGLERAESGLRTVFEGQTLCRGELAVQRLSQFLTLMLSGLHPDPAGRPGSLRPLRETLDRWLDLYEHEVRGQPGPNFLAGTGPSAGMV